MPDAPAWDGPGISVEFARFPLGVGPRCPCVSKADRIGREFESQPRVQESSFSKKFYMFGIFQVLEVLTWYRVLTSLVTSRPLWSCPCDTDFRAGDDRPRSEKRNCHRFPSRRRFPSL